MNKSKVWDETIYETLTTAQQDRIYKCAESHVRENRKSYYVAIHEDTGIQNDDEIERCYNEYFESFVETFIDEQGDFICEALGIIW